MFPFARIVFVFLITLAPPAWAQNLALVLSDDGGMYSEFAETLGESLASSSWRITATPSGDPSLPDRPADLIVTVGAEALRQTLSRGVTAPLIATLLPRQNYEKALAEARRRPARITAIYLDQPIGRQAAFIRHLLPGQNRMGMLFSNETRQYANQFRTAFANASLKLETEDSDADNTLLPALNSLLARSNALVAVPDGTIYRRSNIKAILITAFRHQRPVIGYSAAFVNAGALAAIHSTPSQIARQTADLILAGSASLPPPSGPSQFAITINYNVAQSLGLSVPDEATLRRAILADREAR